MLGSQVHLVSLQICTSVSKPYMEIYSKVHLKMHLRIQMDYLDLRYTRCCKSAPLY